MKEPYVPASEQEAYITEQLLKLQQERKSNPPQPGSSGNPKEKRDETTESDRESKM